MEPLHLFTFIYPASSTLSLNQEGKHVYGLWYPCESRVVYIAVHYGQNI